MDGPTMMGELRGERCKPCEGGVAPLRPEQIGPMLRGLDAWTASNGAISKEYTFGNYHKTIAFVNAVAWISHVENHHPELQVGFGSCKVSYWTHAINGLSENDFICAAKIDALLEA